MNIGFLSQFIDAGKLGGWVRAGVASVLAVAIGKWPLLSAVLDPTTQQAVGVVAAGIVVGIWSHLTKAAPVSAAQVAGKVPVVLAMLLAGSLLAGCATSADLNTSASRKTLYGLTNSYGVLLTAAETYKDLPLCKTGTTTSLTNICSRRSIVDRLQAADYRAITALQNANTFISRFPTLDATNIIAAAVTAMADYQSVMNETGVQ